MLHKADIIVEKSFGVYGGMGVKVTRVPPVDYTAMRGHVAGVSERATAEHEDKHLLRSTVRKVVEPVVRDPLQLIPGAITSFVSTAVEHRRIGSDAERAGNTAKAITAYGQEAVAFDEAADGLIRHSNRSTPEDQKEFRPLINRWIESADEARGRVKALQGAARA